MHESKSKFKTALGVSIVTVFVLGFVALNLHQSQRQLAQRLDQIEDQLAGVRQSVAADSHSQERRLAELQDASAAHEQTQQRVGSDARDAVRGQGKLDSNQDLEIRNLNSRNLTQQKLINDLAQQVLRVQRSGDRMERDLVRMIQTLEREHSREIATLERELGELKRGR